MQIKATQALAILAQDMQKLVPKKLIGSAATHTTTRTLQPTAKRTATNSASAAKASMCMDMMNAQNDAMSSYKSHQARLHNMMEELQRVWFTVFDSHRTPATLRISFRSSWRRLEGILKAIFCDVLQGTMSDLRSESWERLKKTLEALKAELAYHHRRSVLQNQTTQLQECFTDLTQKSIRHFHLGHYS